MEKLEMNDIAKETIEILNLFNPSFTAKISTKFLKYLNKLAENSTKTVSIAKNKKLKEQYISDESKDLISIIYYNYIATDEEKRKIIKIWKNNDILYEKKIMEKYNPNNIFETRKVQEEKGVSRQKSSGSNTKEKYDR